MSAGFTSLFPNKQALQLVISVAIAMAIGGALVAVGLNFLTGAAQLVLVVPGVAILGVTSVGFMTLSIGSEAASSAAMTARQIIRSADPFSSFETSLALPKMLLRLQQLLAEQRESLPREEFLGPPAPPPVVSPAERATVYEEAARERLLQHSALLGSRANFALGWGVFFAIVGVIILGSALIAVQQPDHADIVSYASYYLPRLSITIIVELVAFFFLKTYARTLTDVRYIQNEMTNVEMKLIGLHRSIDLSLPDMSKKAILALVNTERNHVLEKGQSSLELERERIEQEGFIAGARAFADTVTGRMRAEDKKNE